MWDILIIPCCRVHVALCLEDKYEIIQRMKSIRYICRITCASWLYRLKTSGSEIGWALGFELGFLVDMVLGAPVGYPLGYSINMLLVLELENAFDTWEGSLVGVSLVVLYGLMIGTGEGYVVGLSLVIPLGYPLESPNTGAELSGTLLEAPLGLWFVSEVVVCLCCCCHIMCFR